MKFIFNDGGRSAAGYKSIAGDCVVRAVAIATEQPYQQVYDAMLAGAKTERKCRRLKPTRNPSTGVQVRMKWFKDYMRNLGWKWTATMGIGTGCKVHLHDGELPMGRLIVSVSKHYTAVIDGVIHDLYNPERETHVVEPDNGQTLKSGQWRNINGVCSIQRRCVYGYWSKEP